MSDEKKEAQMHSDEGSESIGKHAYIAAKDGDFDKAGFKSSLVIVFGLMTCIFAVTWMTSRKPRSQSQGKQVATPSVTRDDPILGPSLLTERSLTNVVRPHVVDTSVLGKIKVISLRSVSEIPVGSEVMAKLDSGATDGIVKAKITAPLLVDGEPVLPQGTVLFGKGKSGEERLMVEFTKVIFPTGEAFPIRAQAFDSSDKVLGLKGAIVGSRSKKMAGAMAFGFIGGMSAGLQTNSATSLLYGTQPSVRDGALAGASKAALDQSQLYIDELKRSPNIVQVKSGEIIVVIFDEPKKEKDEFHGSK